jgi:eukaryotic-like serine/threonine-protein kinase
MHDPEHRRHSRQLAAGRHNHIRHLSIGRSAFARVAGRWEVAPLTKLDARRQERAHGFPRFLPDGRHFIYAALSHLPENNCLYLASLDGKVNKRLLHNRWTADYAPPVRNAEKGHLLFLRDGALMAEPLDPKTFEPAAKLFRSPKAWDRISPRLFFGFEQRRPGL